MSRVKLATLTSITESSPVYTRLHSSFAPCAQIEMGKLQRSSQAINVGLILAKCIPVNLEKPPNDGLERLAHETSNKG